MTIYKSTNLQSVNIKTLKSSNRSNEKHYSTNPLRNLTEKYIVTFGLKTSLHLADLYQTNNKCQGLVPAYFALIINPRRACAARVMVLGSCVCVCVCPLHFGHYE